MKYIIYREDRSNLWRWTLYGENGRKICESVEKHYNREDCLLAIATVKGSGSAPVEQR